MKKRLLLLALVLLVGGLGWLLAYWYVARDVYAPAFSDEEVAKGLRRLNPGLPSEPSVVTATIADPKRRIRLAIGGLGLTNEADNRRLGDLLTAQMARTPGLELVERQDLDKALRELELNLSGVARPKDAVRVGKLVRAEWFLFGTGGITGDTNKLIVSRIVDARTGAMQDVGVFAVSKGDLRLAAEVAEFVRQTRQNASHPKPRVFLAVGAFTDVGANHRQAEFPQHLRAYLTSAFQHSQMTLLEREYVSALLQEVRLDLAGLTDEPNANPAPMQSAFWLVDGFYQSFETAGYEVELLLRVNRIFGRTTTSTLRGPPQEALFSKVKASIDTTIAHASSTVLAPTRRSEAAHQISLGRDLYSAATGGQDPVMIPSPGYFNSMGEKAPARRARFLEEAVRALETALLLEPESQEARFYLAACCRDWGLGRYDAGASYLREIASSANEDKWSVKARAALGWFYLETDGREAARWFEEAARKAQPSDAGFNFRGLAQSALARAVAKETAAQGGVRTNAEVRGPLEARLFEQVKSSQSVLMGKGGIIDCSYGLEHFVDAFGGNAQAAAERVVELLPALTGKFPDLAPHLLSSVVSFQVDTNAAVIAEFRKSLAACGEHPEKILGGPTYFQNLLCNTYGWCFRMRLHALAAELVEAKRHAAFGRPEIGFDVRDKVRLACAYLRLERWGDALSVLEDAGDVSIVMQADGPWGGAWTPFLPARSAALCREKLGLPAVVKADHFALDKLCLCLHTPSAFVATPDALWIAVGGQLLQLGFDLHTNKLIRLPVATDVPVTAMCFGPDHLWIGTGEGLVEFDKRAGNCRRLTEKDGLLINDITSLCLQDESLWIGFGQEKVGGLGRLDLRSRHISNLTAALPSDPLDALKSDPRDGPPRHAVSGLATGLPGELWMLVDRRGLCRYRLAENTWDTSTFDNNVWLRCFGIRGQRMVAGFSRARPTTGTYEGQLRQRSLLDDRWQNLADGPILPAPPELLRLDGSDVWLGGLGYIAVFDLAQNKIRKVCNVAASKVDQLELAGGYLWAKFDRHLYRAPLSATK